MFGRFFSRFQTPKGNWDYKPNGDVTLQVDSDFRNKLVIGKLVTIIDEKEKNLFSFANEKFAESCKKEIDVSKYPAGLKRYLVLLKNETLDKLLTDRSVKMPYPADTKKQMTIVFTGDAASQEIVVKCRIPTEFQKLDISSYKRGLGNLAEAVKNDTEKLYGNVLCNFKAYSLEDRTAFIFEWEGNTNPNQGYEIAKYAASRWDNHLLDVISEAERRGLL